MHPQVTLEQTPQPSPERDAQPLETPLVPSKGTSRAQPFDMWAAQNGSPEASEQVSTSASTQHIGPCLPGGCAFQPLPYGRWFCERLWISIVVCTWVSKMLG